MDSEQFAAIIAGLQSEGYSRTQIAEGSGLSRVTVWRLAEGNAKEPKYETITRLQNFASRVSPVKQVKV